MNTTENIEYPVNHSYNACDWYFGNYFLFSVQIIFSIQCYSNTYVIWMQIFDLTHKPIEYSLMLIIAGSNTLLILKILIHLLNSITVIMSNFLRASYATNLLGLLKMYRVQFSTNCLLTFTNICYTNCQVLLHIRYILIKFVLRKVFFFLVNLKVRIAEKFLNVKIY